MTAQQRRLQETVDNRFLEDFSTAQQRMRNRNVDDIDALSRLQDEFTSLLERMWRIGALAGAGPEQAFSVKCDLENNPDESRANGRLIVDIGVAPTIPMEFIYFRLGHIRDITKVTETPQ